MPSPSPAEAIRLLELPRDEGVVELLVEIGSSAREVGRTSLQALLALDEDLARSVAVADDRVDRLELRIFEELFGSAGTDPDRLPWAAQIIGLSRRIERYADHGVDIAEQGRVRRHRHQRRADGQRPGMSASHPSSPTVRRARRHVPTTADATTPALLPGERGMNDTTAAHRDADHRSTHHG